MAAKIPPIPKVVPVPTGWRRAKPKEITPKVQRAAVKALQQALPIGKLQAVEVDGKLYGFSTEWHYDDHVTKPGKPIWHPGISTVVPITQPAPVKVASQSVRDAQFIQASRYSGEEDMTDDEECSSEFGGVLTNWFRGLFKKKTIVEPAPAPAPKPVAKPSTTDAIAAAMIANATKVQGDVDFGMCGSEEIEGYDSVEGTDFGDEMADEYGMAEFGDEFGAFRLKLKAPNFKKAVKSIAKAPKKVVKFAVKAPKAAVKFSVKPFKKKSKPAARPAPKPVAAYRPTTTARPTTTSTAYRPTTTARPAQQSYSQPATQDYSRDEAAIDEYFANQAAMAQMPTEEPALETAEETAEPVDYSALEAALENYSAPSEETPETADQGTDTYDESAIRGDCIFG